jgi:hypothetical protein
MRSAGAVAGRARAAALAALVLALFFAQGLPSRAGGADEERYAVVVSPDVQVRDLTVDDLRRVFTFHRRYWSLGRPIRVILPETDLEPGSFLLDRIYGMDYDSLRRMIVDDLDRGTIDLAPRVVASDTVALDYVEAGHGMVTLVRCDALEGRHLHTLTIDGSPPAGTAYALKR